MLESALRLARRVLYLGRSKDGLVRKQIGNNIMYLDLNDAGLSAQLWRMKPKSQDREPAFMKIIRQELIEGMTVMDIGTNIGYVTLIMAELVGSSGKVYALEPDPRNFKILLKNIEVNGYSSVVFPHQIGISNKCSVSKFYVSNRRNISRMVPFKHAEYTIDIAITTFDNFIKGERFPNFIKMDIEGHEVEALQGMHNTLKNTESPVKILMEVHQLCYSEDHDLEKQLKRLIDIGFNTKYVVSAGVAKPDFFAMHGYEPTAVFRAGSWYRGLYTNISNEHMLMTACRKHRQFVKHKKMYIDRIVRAIMIER